ncbi:MAG: pilus assembly protein [Eubacterium sp.]|nr:pilus assembly protein [Eubacterium sp.]
MTVEAALVLPVFLFSMLIIAYIGMLIKTQDEVKNQMTRVVNEASAEIGAGNDKLGSSALYYRGKLELYMGGTGLTTSLLGSSFLEENDEIDMVVSYSVKLPFNLFGLFTPRFKERVHSRAFVGVENREKPEEEDVIVYITENGRVYHMDKNCTYLKPSVSQILYGDVEIRRNRSGGKYKPCAKCAKGVGLGSESPVWITNFGDRYHTNRACSEISRSIKEIMLSEAGNRTPCSKCGGNQ